MKSLVLVLGAGASSEVSLPIGAELKNRIADHLNIKFEYGHRQISGDGCITQSLRHIAAMEDGGRGDINPFLRSCWAIRNAMPQAISVDNFIDSHREDPRIATCGKLAIARCILEAESGSSLKVDSSNIYNRMNFAGISNTWFHAFFQLLTENCNVDQCRERLKSVAVISFNYDRCIEHFLYHSLQNYYGIKDEEAATLLKNLEVHHPYGSVGRLPWMSGQLTMEFGGDPHPGPLVELSKQIRTFTEGTDPATSDIDKIREAVRSTRRIAFLGFAFHRLNMNLLFPGRSVLLDKRADAIVATAYGLSKSDCLDITHELAGTTGISTDRIQIRDSLKCADLFREYWRSLSLN